MAEITREGRNPRGFAYAIPKERIDQRQARALSRSFDLALLLIAEVFRVAAAVMLSLSGRFLLPKRDFS